MRAIAYERSRLVVDFDGFTPSAAKVEYRVGNEGLLEPPSVVQIGEPNFWDTVTSIFTASMAAAETASAIE